MALQSQGIARLFLLILQGMALRAQGIARPFLLILQGMALRMALLEQFHGATHCAMQPLSTACYGTNDRNWDKTNRERVAGAVHDSCRRPSDLGLGLGWRRLHEEAIERLGGEVRAQTCSTRATDGGNKDHVVRH